MEENKDFEFDVILDCHPIKEDEMKHLSYRSTERVWDKCFKGNVFIFENLFTGTFRDVIIARNSLYISEPYATGGKKANELRKTYNIEKEATGTTQTM